MYSTSVLSSTTTTLNRSNKLLNGTHGPTNSNPTLQQPQEEEEEETKTLISNKKFGWDGKSKRNLNKKSLGSVLRRLHWSYVLAIFLFGFITMGVWVSVIVVKENSQSGLTLGKSCTRSLNSRVVNYYVAELYTFENDANSQEAMSAIEELQLDHQSLPYLEVRPLMEGESECWALDQTTCIKSYSPYYSDVSQGLDWLIDQYTKHVINLVNTNASDLLNNNNELEWVQNVGSDLIFQGLDTATFIYFKYNLGKQEWDTKVLTAILAVSCVILLIIYIVLFRPFMNHLRIQHIHTLALLRLAPDDIRFMEVSDKIIDED